MSEYAYTWVMTPNGLALTVVSPEATPAKPSPVEDQQATADVAQEATGE